MSIYDRDWYREDYRNRQISNITDYSKKNKKSQRKGISLGIFCFGVLFAVLVYVLKPFTLIPATIALIAVNVIVFILIKSNKVSYIQLGMSNDRVTGNKEYYRIITSAFTHQEPIHIICNMYSMYNIGSVVEASLGTVIYLISYALILFLGGTLSCMIHKKHEPHVLCIGASGTICGILGIYIAIAWKIYGFRGITGLIPTMVILLLMTASKRIDSIGHFSGLTVGLLCGLAIFKLFYFI